MSVGINFVQYRLKLNAIHCVLPSTIFSCGRADTVILEGEKVFGSDCYVQSAAIGTRGRRGFGLIFTSADEFWDYELAEITFTSLD